MRETSAQLRVLSSTLFGMYKANVLGFTLEFLCLGRFLDLSVDQYETPDRPQMFSEAAEVIINGAAASNVDVKDVLMHLLKN